MVIHVYYEKENKYNVVILYVSPSLRRNEQTSDKKERIYFTLLTYPYTRWRRPWCNLFAIIM